MEPKKKKREGKWEGKQGKKEERGKRVRKEKRGGGEKKEKRTEAPHMRPSALQRSTCPATRRLPE